MKILVTGSEGLIGTSLRSVLAALFDLRCFDLRQDARLDVRNVAELEAALADCAGVVHLAAISRVVWAEHDPAVCWTTNVEGTRNVLAAAGASARRPWVIIASSREVYGQSTTLPATEDADLAPVNAYGRSKVAAERLALDARHAGVPVAVARFSNVYGRTDDHADRVIPCFVRAALSGEALRVEGPNNTFDFTHVNDAVAGILAMIRALDQREVLPPIHFVTGRSTTLAELAALAILATESQSTTQIAPSRSFDVARFWGDPSRARQLLGWSPQVTLEQGIARLAADMRAGAS
jgi:nucleoside-diphosphate-sugar epimerase